MPDPLASQRTELIGQLVASQFAIEAALAEHVAAGGNTATSGELRSQLTLLSDLRQQIGSASGTNLATLRSEVIAATGSAFAIVQQARTAASAASLALSAQAMTPQQARQAIQSVGHDLFDRHVLDPYLQFRDAEDEAAYRKREQENAEALKRALALRTPEGDRRAAAIIDRQLDDAEAHGAAASPDFAALRERNSQARRAIATTQQARLPAANAKPDVAVQTPPTQQADLDEAAAALKAAGVSTLTSSRHAPHHGVGLAAHVAKLETKTGRA